LKESALARLFLKKQIQIQIVFDGTNGLIKTMEDITDEK
jgi:hypothetical protein